MKSTPRISPKSCTGMTCGSCSRAAIRDSRRKRSWKDGSAASSVRNTLTATIRPLIVSCARYTSPIPPTPISERSS